MQGEFHIGKGNKVRPCNAKKVACKLQDFPTAEAAEEVAQALRDVEEAQLAAANPVPSLKKDTVEKATGKGRQEGLPPIKVKPLDVTTWEEGTWDRFELAEFVEFGSNLRGDSEIKEIVDLESIVAYRFGKPYHKLPEDLQQLVQENKAQWSNVSAWGAEEDYGGYYGEDASPFIYPPKDMEASLEEWYYGNPNATDRMGVLSHVRDKGFDTTGLTPVEAVKKLLREENDKVLKYVENATNVYRRAVAFDNISLNKRYLDQVDPRKPESPTSRDHIDGVVYRDPNSGKFRLLDGYHRFKWNSEKSITRGSFLVLQ